MADITHTSASVSSTNTPSSSMTRLSLIRKVTRECLQQMTPAELSSPEYVESTILETIQQRMDIENASRPSNHRWRALEALIPAQIADIIAFIYHVKKIMTSGTNTDADYTLLGIYQEEGEDKGIYLTSDEAFRKIARLYNYNLTKREFDEMITILRDETQNVYPCRRANLIAVNNGIFDYDTKQLMPFSPDYIFLAKSRVNYNQNAVNPVLHNKDDGTDWDVESWMHSLSDDDEIVQTLWEVLGCIIRPNVPWNKSVWFYSETGNNGKGTLCELMRQLCGEGTYAAIPLANFTPQGATAPVSNLFLDTWNISLETLHTTALANTENIIA